MDLKSQVTSCGICDGQSGTGAGFHRVFLLPLSIPPTAPYSSYHLLKHFPNWWVASRFVVGREKCLRCDFFNYIKIKNHMKWESEETKQN
jgi:hypothetical protein